MNTVKINAIILFLIVVKCECGLIDTVLGTISNTTIGLKADVHNVIEYGNDLVFGDKDHADKVPDGHGQEDNSTTTEKHTKGLITNFLVRMKKKIQSAREKVRTFIHGADNAPAHRGVITEVFDSVNTKLKDLQDQFEPTEDPKKQLENTTNAIYKELMSVPIDSNKLEDEIVKMIFQNNSDILKNLNITEKDLLELTDGVKATVADKIVLPVVGDTVNSTVHSGIDIRSLSVAPEA